MTVVHEREVKAGERFEFGLNWSRFLGLLDENRINLAEQSLKSMLGVDSLAGKRFLDAGSGSGLFSLAARRLGAEVYSFDFDPQSVACTRELKKRHDGGDSGWEVEQGSVLDTAFLNSLGRFDVVYSWGVLHHTGSMWPALGNVAPLVADGGQLFIAIYNDQGTPSKRWKGVKRAYNRLPRAFRPLLESAICVHQWWRPVVKDFVRLRPFETWRNHGAGRGMSAWHDVVDWAGGYPFEVAKPERIFDFYRARGFSLERLSTCGGSLGCNEFVFKKIPA
ncbi:MAG: class I SAM-dependent methyltransferase [Bryobacteraceae bacterium]